MNEIILVIVGSICIPIVILFIKDNINSQKMEYTSKNTYLEMEINKLKRSLEYEKEENKYLKEENKKLLRKINELQEDLLKEIK